MHHLWTSFGATDPDSREILEAAFIFTDENMNVLGTFHTYVDGDWSLVDDELVPIQRRSGLEQDWCLARECGDTLTLTQLDREVVSWFTYFPWPECITMAGSGVAGFERVWVAKHLPYLDKRLTSNTLDIGQVHRFCSAAGIPLHPVAKKHRALTNARAHLKNYHRLVTQLTADTDHLSGSTGDLLRTIQDLEREVEAAAETERDRIVAWMREGGDEDDYAMVTPIEDRIERGEHLEDK